MTKSSKENLVFIVITLILIISWRFYRPEIVSFWHSGVARSQAISINSWNSLERGFSKLSMPSFDFSLGGIFDDENTEVGNNAEDQVLVKEVLKEPEDCGESNALDLKSPATYENNKVLSCLGESALACENAKAVLKDPFFPTVFEIIKSKNNLCTFKLSYAADSSLTSITGKKLAGHYILCPLHIVKSMKEDKSGAPVFSGPNTGNRSKYGADIYFYGTLGVFIENNLEQDKIEISGCSGPYIQSVIESYKQMQPQS